MRNKNILLIVFSFLILGCLPNSLKAAELIVNGSFETGTFSSWTITNAGGSWYDWQNTSTGFSNGFNLPTSPQDGTRSVWNGVTANANQQYTMFQQVTIPAGSSASVSWKDRFQMDLLTFCTSVATCGQAFYFVEITNTSGTVLQTLYTVTAPALANTNTGWITHNINLGTTYAGQTIRLRFRDFATVTFAGPGQAEIDAVSLQSPSIITAADASISGKVSNDAGRGISRINVFLTDTNTGESKSVLTNSFGNYQFDELETGHFYLISVGENRRYIFDNPIQSFQVNESLTGINFVGRLR